MGVEKKSRLFVLAYVVLFILLGVFMPKLFAVTVLSFFIALITEPISEYLKKKTKREFLSITLSLVVFYSFVALAVGLLIPVIIEESKYFFDFLKNFLQGEEWKSLPYFDNYPAVKNAINNLIASSKPMISGWVSQSMSRLAVLIPSFAYYLFFSVAGSIYATYYIRHLKKITHTYFFPATTYETVRPFLKKVYRHMRSYILGVTVSAVFTAIAMTVFLSVSGTMYGPLLGTWVFITNYIPIVGVFLEVVPLALATLMKGLWVFVWFWVIVVLVHSTAFFIFLKVVQGQSRLNPFVMILAIIAFSQLFGPFGAFVAVPIAIVIKDYWDDFIVPYLKSE